MKVAVKKRVLFDFLKKRLNENRMPGGDHGGRQIHPFNVQSPNSDPFGFYEDEEETPIKVSDHMAVQLSVPKMPVEDEDFVPGTIAELRNSSTLICQEVPVSQIEYFYRQLHMLLDRAIDRDDQRNLDSLNESFNITKKTTITDFNIISESSRILRRPSKEKTLENLPSELGAEDLSGYESAQNKDEYMRGYNFAADFEDAGKSEEELQQHYDYAKQQSEDFNLGYMAGLDIQQGIQPVNPEDERPLFPSKPGETKLGTGKPRFSSFEQFLARGTRIDTETGDIDTSAFDTAPPEEKAAMDASAGLQEVYKEIHTEATALMMDPAMASEFGAMLTPVTQEFGLKSNEILTPLNIGRMFQYVNKMKNQSKKLAKIQEFQIKIFVIISESLQKVIKKKPRLRKSLQGYAADAGKPFNQFIMDLKQDIASAYTSYGGTSRFTESGDDAVVTHVIDKLFATFIKTLKMTGTNNKFKDRSHFQRNVNLESQDQILDGFKAIATIALEDKKNPGLYVARDRDITVGLDEEELMGAIETFITVEFEKAEETQRDTSEVESQEEIDVSDTSTDEIEEVEAEDYMTALERFTARHARGKNVEWQDMAPYFGYTGTAGIRQYFLKDVLPKLEMMAFTDDTGAPSNVGSLMDFNAQVLTDQMLVVINSQIIPKYEKDVAANKIKQQKVNKKNKVQEVGTVEILGALKEQIVPVLETLQRLFNQGEKYTEIAANREHAAHELLNLVGGYVFREVNMAPITAVYNTMRSDLSDAIADSIISRVGEGKVSRQSIVEKGGIGEYFTRLKNEPDFAAVAESKKGKIVAKLKAIGLTPEVFAEVLVDADESWKEDILDSIQDYDGAVYKEAIEEAVDELTSNPKKLVGAILAGIKATKQEEVYQKLERQTGV